LYKIADRFTSNPLANYTIEIDPRIPEMDNHTSPNNVNLTYNSTSGIYKGKLNLTMTGYRKVNPIIRDAGYLVLKGDSITNSKTSRSIYFEPEF